MRLVFHGTDRGQMRLDDRHATGATSNATSSLDI